MAGTLQAFGPRPVAAGPTGAADPGRMAVFARIAERTGTPAARLMADFAALALGPGRIGVGDYERLRLFDAAFWGDEDRWRVVGARRAGEMALRANFRHDWLGFAGDRIVWSAYLAVHGLPVLPVLAIYRAGIASPAANLLRTRGELRLFLEQSAGEPLLATPAEGGDPQVLFAGEGSGPAQEIESFVADVGAGHAPAWIFQPLPAPPALIESAKIDPRAVIRLVTIAGERGAKVCQALWTLPGGKDIVASLDLRSGRAQRIATPAAPEHGRRAPAGLAAPDWQAIKATAVEGARLLSAFGLLGWDIAPTAEGPVIVGLTAAPELDTCQVVTRCGVLTPEFHDFLAERRRLRDGFARDHAAHGGLDG